MGASDDRWPGCEAQCFAAYCRIIDAVRAAAERCGYAIAVHGSVARDIDLIAAPWTDSAVSAGELALCIAGVSSGFIDAEDAKAPIRKPHGRLCWRIHLGGGPYIDLSVMPRASDSYAKPLENAQEATPARMASGLGVRQNGS